LLERKGNIQRRKHPPRRIEHAGETFAPPPLRVPVLGWVPPREIPGKRLSTSMRSSAGRCGFGSSLKPILEPATAQETSGGAYPNI